MALKFDGKYLQDGSKILCNLDGKLIRDGRSTGGTKLIKVSDAARKIGATSRGPTTAAMWFKFCR